MSLSTNSTSSETVPPLSCLSAVSDEHLVERVRAGEPTFYGELMNRHNRRLHSLARRILRNDADAEDAVQEAHIRVLSRLEQYAGRSSFLTWMSRIVINEALSRLRAQLRSPGDNAPVRSDSGEIVLVSHARSPEQEAMNQELCRVLQAALAALPEKYRAVFELREMHGINVSEAAARLGVTATCVKVRLHRAKLLLRGRIRRHAAAN
jgi:RNA polymerase sigma-70 factor (ECF subfamily)